MVAVANRVGRSGAHFVLLQYSWEHYVWQTGTSASCVQDDVTWHTYLFPLSPPPQQNIFFRMLLKRRLRQRPRWRMHIHSSWNYRKGTKLKLVRKGVAFLEDKNRYVVSSPIYRCWEPPSHTPFSFISTTEDCHRASVVEGSQDFVAWWSHVSIGYWIRESCAGSAQRAHGRPHITHQYVILSILPPFSPPPSLFPRIPN